MTPREATTSGGGRTRRPGPDLEAALGRLDAMSDTEFAIEWEAAQGAPLPPGPPARLLRLARAHALQAAALGGLKPALARRLDRMAAGEDETEPSDRRRWKRIVIKPGATLVRDWRGRPYRVEVEADGSFSWGGRRWRSLSAIARAITGVNRNGPAFFGLREDAGDEAA
ncbi:DUF2924 domain-containing protein [Pikeienuella sp. HZG-20]|uniref:DUF2924 domain-containing protein n=1 Tax=Paludibacillus litoralis TaxID=3133267 RepID=UPI0030EE15E9